MYKKINNFFEIETKKLNWLIKHQTDIKNIVKFKKIYQIKDYPRSIGVKVKLFDPWIQKNYFKWLFVPKKWINDLNKQLTKGGWSTIQYKS